MRRALSAVVLALAAAAGALGQANAEEARKELDLGAREYRARRYAEAERRFRRALELDPTQKDAPTYIARAVHQQYKPGDMAPENLAAGERAVAAYQDVLKADPANEDAFKAVLLLYGQMRNDQKVQEMLLWRANDFSAPNDRRAEAFVTLATRHWKCSHDVTEQQGNKTTEQQPDKPAVVKYKMPADQSDFLKARQCVTDGLRLAEQAISLDPNSRSGWSFKSNLLQEAAKLAEMEGDAAQKAEFERLHAEAAEAQKRLGAATPPLAVEAGDASAPAPNKTVVQGGVLNGKAVSKPTPSYPDEAKRAGAQGTVTVHIVVDEEGKVIEATAVSGHPLLHDAAVSAARRARFSPTRLSGVPVKVSGRITYNFVLQ